MHDGAEKEEDCESFCLTDAGLTAVVDGFPKLEKFSLIWCSNVTSLGIMSLAQKSSFLKSLDLQVIHNIPPETGDILLLSCSIMLMFWLILSTNYFY